MEPLLVASLLQLFFLAMLATRGEGQLSAMTYVPIGVALMGITFAAMTLATPM